MTKPSLEQLLTPKWRGFIRRLADALDAHGVNYAVIGGMALGKRAARVRATEDIDILVGDEHRRAVMRAVRDAGLTRLAGNWPLVSYTDGTLSVDILCGEGDPEESMLALAAEVPLFGRQVPVATRPFLLWTYLLSDRPQHHEDALNVLRAINSAELRQLKLYLKHDKDAGSLRRLERWTAEALG